jgi:hypothetical protein
MIFGCVGAAGCATAGLSGEGEVVQASDAKHGVVDAVAFEAAVAKDLPGLHAGECMLNSGPDLFVRAIVLLFPLGQFLAGSATVRHHESGAGVTAVGDRDGLPDGGLGSGLAPRLAVVAVARQWLADHDDQAGVGVDDDLVVGPTLLVGRMGCRRVRKIQWPG